MSHAQRTSVDGLIPAMGQEVAAYVRMSTEHQQYSTSNQLDVIKAYADARDMKIVRVYSDEGKSGLRAKGRNALSKLIADIEGGTCRFGAVLVYDVSRWGRFQDADEAAYYEFRCKQKGIAVHYCAEQFENDGSPMGNINKMMKRMMAGDYSRELSAKVFQGACRLIRLGYKQGGAAGYGLRRMLVDHTGKEKTILSRGEQKSIQTDRIILVLGPDEEVRTVMWMYRAFVYRKLPESVIAERLNRKGVQTDLGRPWTRGTVHQVLTNEKYIGNNVYHRTSFKLKTKHVRNEPEYWVRADGAWSCLVAPEMYYAAQKIILERSRKLSNEEMLESLRTLLERHGKISGILIDEDGATPSSSAFRHRFGSLVAAYSLIGYTPATDYAFIEQNRAIRRLRPDLMREIFHQLAEVGAIIKYEEEDGPFLLNGELRLSIVLCRHFTTLSGSSRWLIRFDAGLKPDITIAARLNHDNSSVKDYYIIPMMDITPGSLLQRLADENGIEIDAYRHDDLSRLHAMAKRTPIKSFLL